MAAPHPRLVRAGLAGCALGVLAACAAAGTRPHDMSAARHVESAGAERELATAHAAEYDPTARERLDCGAYAVLLTVVGPCWSEIVNPTEGHRIEAERHREAAAAHRAAAAELRELEASACGDVSDADRDVSPFCHRDDIASVTDLVDRSAPAADENGVVGATVVFASFLVSPLIGSIGSSDAISRGTPSSGTISPRWPTVPSYPTA